MNNIHTETLQRLDLNLLVAFDALGRRRSVTLAAKDLGMTQSAMSHALRRMREALGDPLFVRGGQGMVPTPHAAFLEAPVRAALMALAEAVAPPGPFEAGSSQRTFRIVVPDLFEVLAVPRLLGVTQATAPGVRLSVAPWSPSGVRRKLESGEVDVAVQVGGDGMAPFPHLDPQGLVRRTVVRDGWLCFARSGHPRLVDGALDLDAYLAADHALVTPSGQGGGLVDAILAAQGRTRRVVLRIPHFFSAPALIAGSDLILTAPGALARVLPDNVVAIQPPLALPQHSLSMVWHERFDNDAGHQWFRQVAAEVWHD